MQRLYLQWWQACLDPVRFTWIFLYVKYLLSVCKNSRAIVQEIAADVSQQSLAFKPWCHYVRFVEEKVVLRFSLVTYIPPLIYTHLSRSSEVCSSPNQEAARNQRKQVSAATCLRWFIGHGFFYPEYGGDTFLRNVSSHKIYTASHPRRRHSSINIRDA
jgi:hypothetical protein